MTDELTEIPRRSIWNGWGDPAQVKPVPALAWPLFKRLRGIEPAPVDTPSVSLEEVELPPVRISDEALAALGEVVGAEFVSTDRLERVEHAGGKSYPDLYRMRTGDGSRCPDAVVFPGSSAEVAAVLGVALEHRVAVVPFGGGTSVVGGVDPLRGEFASVITVDLRRLNQVLDVDTISQTALVQAGMRGPEFEAATQPYGLTLGHFPQSYQQASIGGYLVTRSAGQASSGYGRFEENVVSVTVATPTGEVTLGGRAPARETAAGPKLIDVLIGSEGLFGIVTQARLQLHPVPAQTHQESWAFKDLDTGFAAFRALAQEVGPGFLPDVSRLSDADETMLVLMQSNVGIPSYGLLKARGWKHPSLAVFQLEDSDKETLKFRRSRLAKVLRAHGAQRMPSSIAEHWMSHRFRGPYQRDHLMDRGIFVETLETATTWENLRNLYDSVQQALHQALGEKVIVQAHVSHLEAGGASLYFTFLQQAESDPIAQWARVKQLVGDAIIAAGGTITHHHAVGTDHRPWIETELTDGGVRILRAIKKELDPVGILNPGKLLPEEGA